LNSGFCCILDGEKRTRGPSLLTSVFPIGKRGAGNGLRQSARKRYAMIGDARTNNDEVERTDQPARVGNGGAQPIGQERKDGAIRTVALVVAAIVLFATAQELLGAYGKEGETLRRTLVKLPNLVLILALGAGALYTIRKVTALRKITWLLMVAIGMSVVATLLNVAADYAVFQTGKVFGRHGGVLEHVQLTLANAGVFVFLASLFWALFEAESAYRRLAKQRAELEQALSEVKTLTGLLPLCASCKKVRDDAGYWNQIEVYLRGHADVTVSHSLCPECEEKLYPELKAD